MCTSGTVKNAPVDFSTKVADGRSPGRQSISAVATCYYQVIHSCCHSHYLKMSDSFTSWHCVTIKVPGFSFYLCGMQVIVQRILHMGKNLKNRIKCVHHLRQKARKRGLKKVFSSFQTYQTYIQEAFRVFKWLSMTFLASFLKKETLVMENYCPYIISCMYIRLAV